MPKELKELSGFIKGTMTSPSATDLPDETAVYAKNLDPITEAGKLKGIPDDIKVKTAGAGLRLSIANYSVDPADNSAGTSSLFVDTNTIGFTITAGSTSIVSNVITYATSNNNTWQLVLSELTSDTLSFTRNLDCSVDHGDGASHTHNVLTEDEEYTNINVKYATVIKSIVPITANLQVDEGNDDEIEVIEHGSNDGATGSVQEVIGLMIESLDSIDDFSITITSGTTKVYEQSGSGEYFSEYLPVAGNEMQFLKDKTKDNLFYYDKADSNKIKLVEDFYGAKSIIEGPMEDTITDSVADQEEGSYNLPSSDDVSMENYNNAMYIGPGRNNKSKWMGFINKTQLNQNNNGFFLVDSELSPIDGKEGSSSLSRISVLPTSSGLTSAAFESGFINGDYWIGINSNSYNLFSVNQSTGAIVGSDETLPIKPKIIAPCKHIINANADQSGVAGAEECVWIADGVTNNIYRVEGISIDGSHKITWASIVKFSGSFDVNSGPVDHAVLVDIMETYDSTGTVNRDKHYLWGLYSTGSTDTFAENQSFIYSARFGSGASLVSYKSGSDDSFTWRDRTPPSKTLTKKNGSSFYDDSNLINWGNSSKYLSNKGVHQRQRWKYSYKKPSSANQSAWCTSGVENTRPAAWTTPEHGYTIVDNIYDTGLESVTITPYNQSTTGSATRQYSSYDRFQTGDYSGWKEGLSVAPLRLVSMSHHNFDTTYNSVTYKSHVVGAFAIVKGDLVEDAGRLSYYKYSRGSYDTSHYYKFYNSKKAVLKNYNGLCLLTTSTNHYGIKHYYEGSIDAANVNDTMTRFDAGESSSFALTNVRTTCLNQSTRVGISAQPSDSIGGTDIVTPIDNPGDVFDITQLIPAGEDFIEHAIVSYRGDDTSKAHITIFDLSTVADDAKLIDDFSYIDPNNYPKIFGSSVVGSDRQLQGSILGVNTTKLLISPTSGQYENGLMTLDASALTTTSAYTTNDGSVEDYGINITAGETNTDGAFKQGVTYYYKASLLYDDFQESPLTQSSDAYTVSGNNLSNLLLQVNTKRPTSPRVTHLILYRKNGPDEFYKMVKEIKLSSAWLEKSNGEGFSKTIIDDGSIGATYEAITGMPETLRDTSVNYQLSTQADGSLFVANCDHPEIENGDHFIFKSQIGNLSVFNWAQDYLIMPQIPTAIKSYAGKLYVWDTANMYRVNTMNLQIEDTYEGMGCTSENSVIVTDRGMFFCDETNMYMHNGTSVNPIGDPILQNAIPDPATQFVASWQDITHATPPLVTYNAKSGCVYFMFNHNNTNFGAWIYNVRLRRWDLIDCPKPLSTVLGPKNEVLVSDGYYLWHLNSSGSTKAWSYHSKSMTMGLNTQDKSLKKVKVEADDITKVPIKLNVNGTSYASNNTVIDSTGNKDTALILTPKTNLKKFKNIRIEIDDSTTEVDSIGIIYSKKGVK